jgi:hypothetical protein
MRGRGLWKRNVGVCKLLNWFQATSRRLELYLTVPPTRKRQIPQCRPLRGGPFWDSGHYLQYAHHHRPPFISLWHHGFPSWRGQSSSSPRLLVLLRNCCPLSPPRGQPTRQVPFQMAWQSSIGWGDAGFEPGTFLQQSGALYWFIKTVNKRMQLNNWHRQIISLGLGKEIAKSSSNQSRPSSRLGQSCLSSTLH